jgi:cytochrome c553
MIVPAEDPPRREMALMRIASLTLAALSLHRRRLWCSVGFVTVLFVAASAHGAEETGSLEKSFEQQVRPFLKQYCVRCHRAEKMTSGVRVDHLNGALEDRQLRLWEAIQKQLSEEAMPPEGGSQPTKAERQWMIDWVSRAMDVARSRPVPKNGSVRRLTVAQYRNTLRELLQLEEDLTDVLPPDAVSRDGFLNNQATLQLSPLLLEAYLEIAEKALDCCIVDPKAKPTIQNFRVDLGASINPAPCPDKLILGANSLLLDNKDFVVTQLTPRKPFDFDPFVMRTKYRFIEGYQGNDTVRGWRDFNSIYHAVYACMRGTDGYPRGLAYSTVPQGLLLRPAIPSAELFGIESTYGPRANFKIALRELPKHGRFRVTVTAAKYNDGLLLDPGVRPQPEGGANVIICRAPKTLQTITIKQAGIYQVDVHTAASGKPPATTDSSRRAAGPVGAWAQRGKNPSELKLILGDREFSGTLQQPAFLVVRLPAGEPRLSAQTTGTMPLDRIVLTPLAETQEPARRFGEFEKRSPRLGVHLGLRRDCGSTLAPVGTAQTVASEKLSRYVFEGAIRNYPSPDVEKDNVNYLAGIHEIGVRSEYTDGRDMPRLLIRSVEFEGPLYETWPPPSHRNIFLDFDRKDDPAAYGQKVIREFAARAYRRPITAQEESMLMAVFKKSLGRGSSFQESVKDALQVVLTSPQFLFLIENSRTSEPEPLDGHELASKLSYFLWNGPPDQTTLQLAATGQLRNRLDAEVGRMIDDPRFARFVGEFASQWLALDKFQVLEPDRKRFPKLTRDTRAQLRQEPTQFLQYLIRNNLPVRNLIESDFVVANEVVAGYYDLSGKTGSGFEFVPIPHGRRELGGVLTQAAILAGLSDGRESNPVKRGAWLARRIIAEPPDDPPPNVPALKEETRNLSLRERLERHRNQPGCAQCHAKIDPWGVPFEEFDAGGRLKLQSVDARSTLPDKRKVAGVNELRRYLANDRIDQVAFSVLKHLSIYAIGRSLTFSELDYLRRNGVKLKGDGYRMHDMIRFIVNSPMFLEK